MRTNVLKLRTLLASILLLAGTFSANSVFSGPIPGHGPEPGPRTEPLQLQGTGDGGGGSPSSRTSMTEAEIKEIIRHEVSLGAYVFNHLVENFCNFSNCSPNPIQDLVTAIKNKLEAEPGFFKRVALSLTTDGSCVANGIALPASFVNNVLCFDPALIKTYQYSRFEAEVKLMALYFHEIGHAVGYDHNVASEDILNQFRDQIEKNLIAAQFSLREALPRAHFNPLDKSPYSRTLGDRLEELSDSKIVKRMPREEICLKLERILDHLNGLSWTQRQQSYGIRKTTSEAESFIDLAVWRITVFTEVNCQGEPDQSQMTISSWSSLPRTASLSEAIHAMNGITFCESEYSEKICAGAKGTSISTRKVRTGKFRKEAAAVTKDILTLLESIFGPGSKQ